MAGFTRRSFLRASSAAAFAAALTGCGGSSGAGPGDAGQKALSWWDHYGPLQPLEHRIFARYASHAGAVPVSYTFYNAAKMGPALQLAKQGNQLPDVSSLAGLELPTPALIQSGWLRPMDLDAAARDRLDSALVDGIHVFDGKVYTFPTFSFRQYASANWFNKTLVAKAGLDPSEPPETYDEFRAAARAVQKHNSNVYGVIWNAGMPPRMEDQVNDMAQAAGFEGVGGLLFRTGEYAYHSEPYLNVVEFLVSLLKDKVLLPGSTNLIDKVARARWVTGVAAYYFDGPWCAGAALQVAKEFGRSLGVGPMLVPEKGMPVTAYRTTKGGSFWLSKTADHVQAANRLLSDYFTTDDYYVGVATYMDQPPRKLSAVAKSPAHPAYKHLIEMYDSQVFLAPDPVIKNLAVTKVQAGMTQVTPALGDIVQGALTGSVRDVRGALRQLSDKSTAARERALTAAKQKGATVSPDDWAFSGWKSRTDYTKDMYGR